MFFLLENMEVKDLRIDDDPSVLDRVHHLHQNYHDNHPEKNIIKKAQTNKNSNQLICTYSTVTNPRLGQAKIV